MFKYLFLPTALFFSGCASLQSLTVQDIDCRTEVIRLTHRPPDPLVKIQVISLDDDLIIRTAHVFGKTEIFIASSVRRVKPELDVKDARVRRTGRCLESNSRYPVRYREFIVE